MKRGAYIKDADTGLKVLQVVSLRRRYYMRDSRPRRQDTKFATFASRDLKRVVIELKPAHKYRISELRMKSASYLILPQ